ncbi:hypothetical protein EDI_238120 [Entamoeba dispar SAW760]|uniref:Uncharacterized protein n=1 Tax=Entamoeba dispar (strain ATCC PRA-260 / SAW760) TaxID=370354 RepID=B0E8C1_ENTDS|nr:uncharacterized protein EDI_238120 [Entamoeba dispar SAW760]EDR29246.1 hypothetical protein EDI_238120 [Entamoeba dispar SAW760]|eukprot:EDR29246.1 hypothetical protein EDI_238120 [Entamoeba dispar SAW760]
MTMNCPESSLSRDRKRISRSSEACITNAIVYVFISQLNTSATFRKTKRSKQTVKMYLPETINLNGTLYDQNTLASMSDSLIKEIVGEEPMDIKSMNDKQYNRSKEAQINNGLLYLLRTLGYSFDIKQTKKTKCTERLVKINSLITPFGDIIERELLESVGTSFSKQIEEMFGREMTITVTNESLQANHASIPTLPFSFYKTEMYQQSVAKSIPIEGSIVGSYISDGNEIYFVPNEQIPFSFTM